jgi:malate dehydrogenase (oxaloacetate-decarboxylating)(NADP+)
MLRDAEENKSTAFTEEEREAFGLTGLLPWAVETLENQVQRVMQQLETKTTDLGRYIYLISLLDADERLFYKVVMSDTARFLPILYSPTVGEACLKFGHIFRRPRGMYLSIKHKGRVKQVLNNWPQKDVRVICATSGGRILGLGDLGANGMGIPIGKLQLYTACAAVPPGYLLPLHIDSGTNNQALIDDPLYLGMRQPRVSADELDDFLDEFVEAAQEVFPGSCIHFEDWDGVDAMRHLARYKDKVSCYNDDIQGTGGVILAGLFSALKVTGSCLSDQRILFFGAGSAGVGIADLIVSAMAMEGLTEQEARSRIFLFNSKGLIESTRTVFTISRSLTPINILRHGISLPPLNRSGPLRLSASAPGQRRFRNRSSKPWPA